MRNVARALAILGLAIGSASCAMAQGIAQDTDVTWTFSNVVFSNGDTVTGDFVTNPGGTGVLSYSIVVNGPTGQQVFTATECCTFLPNAVGFGSPGWFQFVDLFLTSPVTQSGGVIPIGSGYDCGGGLGPCWMLLVGGGHDPEIIGIRVPESSALLNLDLVSSLGVLGFLMLRRKISHALKRGPRQFSLVGLFTLS